MRRPKLNTLNTMNHADIKVGERYPYTKETARAAAEAERDRLNAEHRKEQA